MEHSDKTAREIYEALKANPTRARFGFGREKVFYLYKSKRVWQMNALALCAVFVTDKRPCIGQGPGPQPQG